MPDETLGTPRKKFKTRQGKVLRKSTQALALRHDNVHSGPAPLPIDRNSRKHEKSTGSTVVLPSSSTPTPPSFSLLAILAVGGLGAALFTTAVTLGVIGSGFYLLFNSVGVSIEYFLVDLLLVCEFTQRYLSVCLYHRLIIQDFAGRQA